VLKTTAQNSRLFAVLLLGFSSGLPLALTGSTLQAWFSTANVSLVTIGALSLIGIPYTWKFLWAPLLDYFVPPMLGLRRGWMLIMQLGLCVSLFFLSFLHPEKQTLLIGYVALFIAFLSASQDMAIDAYRTDILLPEERGLGSAVYIFSYRMAMLVSGGFALILAEQIGWQLTFEIMAVLMALMAIVSFCAPDVAYHKKPATLYKIMGESFKDLLKRQKIIWILLFILFYKIGDALALSLMTNFLLHTLEFSLTQVGFAYKTVGLLATILGALCGGLLLVRMSLFNALLWFGLLQAFSNICFMFLALVGKNYLLMAASIFIESFCSGLSTAAFVAFLMSLCHHEYTATQFALLSAVASVGRVFSGPIASAMVLQIGWSHFFAATVVLSFPGIILLMSLRRRIYFNNAEATV